MKADDECGIDAAGTVDFVAGNVGCCRNLIAGEALVGLFIAAVVGFRSSHQFWAIQGLSKIAPWLAIPVFAILAAYLILVPLKKAGDKDEPAPPTAVM